jgi:type I restriction-modification system DNA methylase subunit
VTKEEAKLKIIDLVQKFRALEHNKVKGFNEAATKQGFIQPLFEALGWDFSDTDEVSPEDNTSNGRVDYAFKLHNVAQFYVEAKPFKEDINDPKHIKQAVSYAYNKGVTWAILTNFQSLRVFNAQKTEPFISLDYNLYDTDFERLWLLSRESLTSGLLNQEAVKWGALPILIPVEKRLFAQMRVWREQLFNQFFRYNEKFGLKPEQVDEIIQKLFNRLIFIRTAEDRGIEEKGLLALLHQWKTAGAKGKLLDALRQLFKEYDGYYDSELFDQKLQHLLDNPEVFVENEVIESILLGLYEIPGSMANYNFNDIDADVLGAVYEQYLGHVAEVMKQRAKEAQSKMDLGISAQSYTLTAKKERRKEHGIYYTPKFITDYIVRETVGRYLQENAGYPDKLHNIKILDPACGSGSFLIRAYDELLKYHANELKKPLNKLDQWERLPILTNSIYGVDLDKQAMEITRLNLLLRSLAHREPLPFLGDNIKQGNSLVSGTDEELEKHFGAGWENQHPFNWQDEFSGVMDRGGFDIVIGNPPYIRQEQLSEFKPLWQKAFECYDGVADIYVYFFERGLQLLKEGGFLAFISPNKYFRSGYGEKLREFLSTKTTITQIIDFGDAPVFDAITCPSIIVLRKSSPDKNKTRIYTWNPTEQIEMFSAVVDSNSSTINQNELTAVGWHLESKTTLRLLEKLSKMGKPLGDYVNGKFYYGIKTGLNESFVVDQTTRDHLIAEHLSSAEVLKPVLRGKDIKRWGVDFAEQYLIKIESSENVSHPWSGKTAFEAEKIFASTYPAIHKWLNAYRKGLIERDDQGKYFWELRSCKYWQEFEQFKIVWGNLAVEPKFALAVPGYFVTAPANIIVTNSKYLLGVLNSRVTQYLVSQSAAERQGGYLEYKPMYISPLAIPEQPKNENISNLVSMILVAKAKDSKADVSKLEHQIDQFVYQLYGLTPEEIALVEGKA